MFNYNYYLYCFKMNICFHEENIKTNKVLLINTHAAYEKYIFQKVPPIQYYNVIYFPGTILTTY